MRSRRRARGITALGVAIIMLTGVCQGCARRASQDVMLTGNTPVVPHPWPMAQHDAQRTGGDSALTPLEARPTRMEHIKLGPMGRFNAPVLSAQLACVGSVGAQEGVPDASDGVSCVTLSEMTLAWRHATAHDALATSLVADQVIATTRGGEVVALALADGAQRWALRVGQSPVSASPLILSDGLIVVADQAGAVVALRPGDGSVVWRAQVDGGVWGGLAADETRLYVVTDQGRALALARDTGATLWKQTLHYLAVDDGVSTEGGEARTARMEAAPVVAGELLVVGYMREGAQPTPALQALRVEDGSLAWEAQGFSEHVARWGDVRASPVFVEDRLIFASSQGRAVGAVSASDGGLLFVSQGTSCVEDQVSGLAFAGDMSYVPRQDGALYLATHGYGLSPWRVWLASTPQADLKPPGEVTAIYKEGGCLVDPPGFLGYLTTPAFTAASELVIGAADGTLYKLAAN